jgi:hypothetical protein
MFGCSASKKDGVSPTNMVNQLTTKVLLKHPKWEDHQQVLEDNGITRGKE